MEDSNSRTMHSSEKDDMNLIEQEYNDLCHESGLLQSRIILIEERLKELRSRLGGISTTPEINTELTNRGGQAVLETLLSTRLIDVINIGILIIEPETHSIVDLNNVAAEKIGQDREHIIGQKCYQFVCPAEKGHCPITDLGQAADYTEWFVLTSTGREIPVIKRVDIIAWQGQKYFVESFIDITDLKAMELRQQRLLQQLQHVNHELTEFAYVVSHDLKAPLRGIKTLIGWLETDYAEKLDQDGQEHIALLISRVEHMENLINGILHYSKAGHVEQMSAYVNLNEWVPTIIDMMDPPNHIKVIIENELPYIQGDTTRLTQVFQNLIENAIKYMDKPEGQIIIRCEERDQDWLFTISDNGPGIEFQNVDKIFKLFQTLAPAHQTESTGVGLAVVRKIIQGYGGEIWVDSEPGQGSTFFFTLPMAKNRVLSHNESNEEI